MIKPETCYRLSFNTEIIEKVGIGGGKKIYVSMLLRRTWNGHLGLEIYFIITEF